MLRRILASVALGGLILVPFALHVLAEEEASTVERKLVVARYHTVSLTNEEADRILNDKTNVLKDNDGDGDFPADIRLVRDGDVQVFTEGDGSIDSASEFQEVNTLPGNVKVVHEINWCGGPAPTAIGCAPVPGNSMVVERFSPALEGILWAHEYGHNCGLGHRNVEHMVMRPFIGSTHRRINEPERDKYVQHGPMPLLLAANGDPQPLDGHIHVEAADQERVPVEEFVTRTYFHGIPWDEASTYDEKDVPKLLEMLKDPDMAPFKANIVTTLGLIGDERAIEPLQAVIASGEGRISGADYKARKAAVLHLGTLYGESKNKEVLEYLRKGATSVEFWNETARWRPPDDQAANQRNKQLVTMAIWGLGVSGTPEARQVLQSISRGRGPFEAATDPIVDEAVKINEQVREKGISGYYRSREAERAEP